MKTAAGRITDDQLARARATRIEIELYRRGIRNLRRLRNEIVGPCPMCGGRDRFSVHLTKQLWNCRGCGGGGAVVDLVMMLDACDFVTAVATLAGEPTTRTPAPAPTPTPTPTCEPVDQESYARKQAAKANWLWRQRRPIEGSIAELYLRNRGINIALPPTLGYLPATDRYPPAMIAAFGVASKPEPGVIAIDDTAVQAVHLTKLADDGSDRLRTDGAKIVVGRPNGFPIVLAPPNDLMALAISEGIEDALALHQALGVGAWAAYSAGAMPKLADVVPNYIEVCTIEAHPETAGQRGAHELARRLRARGIEVFLREGAS